MRAAELERLDVESRGTLHQMRGGSLIRSDKPLAGQVKRAEESIKQLERDYEDAKTEAAKATARRDAANAERDAQHCKKVLPEQKLDGTKKSDALKM